jgi:uncharacterized membrane protein YqjE
MLDTPPSTSTRQLLAELSRQISELVSIEARLFRAELKETSSKLVSAAGMVACGFVLALGGLLALLAAAALFLIRLRVAPDLACVIVAVVGIAVGGGLVLAARHSLSSKIGTPRTLRQLSTLRLK